MARARIARARNVRGEASRARILDAAVACLAEDGIEAVRIARVADAAGVSTGLVHYHFATREELLAEAIQASFRVAGDVRTSTKYGSGTALERLQRKIEESLPFPGRREREWELWVELWLRAVREPPLRDAAAAVYRQLHWSLRQLLIDGVDAGEFVVDDPADLADRVLALIDGYGLRALLRDPGMPVERAREQLRAALSAELARAELSEAWPARRGRAPRPA
jgi:AcrR family transcriptional regulator